jgi:hypothetical protein
MDVCNEVLDDILLKNFIFQINACNASDFVVINFTVFMLRNLRIFLKGPKKSYEYLSEQLPSGLKYKSVAFQV